MTADAGAVVKAFNTYAKWCSDQAQVDGYQQELLAPAPAAPTPAVYAAPAPVVEYIVFCAAPAQVVEYLAPVPLAYAAPVVSATVGFASLPVKPIVSDDDSCRFLRTTCSRQHCFHKCRHREICRQGRKCHRGHLFSYKLGRIGGLGVDRSECRERKRWRRTSANLRLNFGTLWILSSARSRLCRVKWPRTLHFAEV